MEWDPALKAKLKALLKFTVHEPTTMFQPSLQSALRLLLRQLTTVSRRPRTIPRAVSPHPASGAPELVPATRRRPKIQNMSGSLLCGQEGYSLVSEWV